jgi:hypothetical protein
VNFYECDGESSHTVSVQNGMTENPQEQATDADKNGWNWFVLAAQTNANQQARVQVRSVAIETGNGPAKRLEATSEPPLNKLSWRCAIVHQFCTENF